jgi:hypothetical protein
MNEILHPGQTPTPNGSPLVTASEQGRRRGTTPMPVVAAAMSSAETPEAIEGEPVTPEIVARGGRAVRAKTSLTLTLVAARRQSGPAPEKENAARAALELLAGRTLRDSEWDRMRARLLEFVSILRDWRQENTTGESELLKAA